MTRVAVAGCTALAVLSAAAVLDFGSKAAEAAPSVSPFAGTYVWGTWFPVTISDGGRITSPSSNPDVNGSVSADGTYSFTWTESGLIDNDDNPRPGGRKRYTYSDKMTGHMALDSDGNIVGTIDPDYNNTVGGSYFWLRQ